MDVIEYDEHLVQASRWQWILKHSFNAYRCKGFVQWTRQSVRCIDVCRGTVIPLLIRWPINNPGSYQSSADCLCTCRDQTGQRGRGNVIIQLFLQKTVLCPFFLYSFTSNLIPHNLVMHRLDLALPLSVYLSFIPLPSTGKWHKNRNGSDSVCLNVNNAYRQLSRAVS